MKKKAKGSIQQHQQDLTAELTALRTNFVDIISRYQANQEARLLACIESLSGSLASEQENVNYDDKRVLGLLVELQEIRLKPEKGRLKDVRRMDELIDKIYKRLVLSS